jgi:hypothetical protein
MLLLMLLLLAGLTAASSEGLQCSAMTICAAVQQLLRSCTRVYIYILSR